jgi:hypothetical protein
MKPEGFLARFRTSFLERNIAKVFSERIQLKELAEQYRPEDND